MPVYAYRCQRCGTFDVVRPMREAGDPQACPDCGTGSQRLFSPPAVRRVTPSLARALGAQERSAGEPSVVSAVPPGGRRPPPAGDPRRASLPRP